MTREWVLRATPLELVDRYEADGYWTNDTLGQLLDTRFRTGPDHEFRVWSAARPWSGTVGEVYARALRFAGGLQTRGIGPGDVVAFQLPNSVEAAIVFWATAALGAVVVPIVHFYGHKEVDYILGEASPDLFVGSDDLGVFDELCAADAISEPVVTDAETPALIAYTSGTTANPKGVIHTHRSIVAEVKQLGAIQPPQPRPTLVGASVGHAIGMLSALLLPVHRGQGIHLIDTWDPPTILDAMVEADLTAGHGATYFLTSLLDAPGFGPEHLDRMRWIGLGGASVPEAVADRAIGLGISISRSYGSTEHPSITGASHDTPQAQRKSTDGRALPGVELRLVDPSGNEIGRGVPGEILSRGPDLCAGYTDSALTAESFTDDGWFRTGDVGVLDTDGWLTITDRISDIVIRGGENVSAVEVEGLLVRMPEVVEVAVVAAPDERLGEHACAFIRLAPGASEVGLGEVRAHLTAAGLARQKWPEELRFVDDLPRTPSGKVKKFELRDRL